MIYLDDREFSLTDIKHASMIARRLWLVLATEYEDEWDLCLYIRIRFGIIVARERFILQQEDYSSSMHRIWKTHSGNSLAKLHLTLMIIDMFFCHIN